MNKKTIYWTLGGVATAVVAYLAYKKLINKSVTFDNTSTTNSGQSTTVSVKTITNFPLKKGSKGDAVKSLQKFLNAEGKKKVVLPPLNIPMPLIADGDFGAKTETALIDYQKALKASNSKTQQITVGGGFFPTEAVNITSDPIIDSIVLGQASQAFYDKYVKGKY